MDFVPCSLFGIHLPELLWYAPCTPHGSYGYCYIAIILLLPPPPPPFPSLPPSLPLPSPPFFAFHSFSRLLQIRAVHRRTPKSSMSRANVTRNVKKKQAKEWTRRKNDLLVSYNTFTPLHHLFDWKPRPGIWSCTPSRQSSSFPSIPPIVFEFLASGRSTMIGKCERAGPPAYYVGCSSTDEESAARAFEENVL